MSKEKQTTQADKAKRETSSRATTTKRTTNRTAKKNMLTSSKLFCTNCGHELSNGEKFCPACGTKVSRPQDEKSPASPVPDACPAEPMAPAPEQKEPIPDVPPVKHEPPQADSAQVGEWPAFVEMWHFIKQLPLKPSREEKRELRCQAKKRMYKAPILSIACPVTAFVLFLLSLLLATAGGIKSFFAPMLVFLLITTSLIVLFLCIFFTKLKDGDEVALSTTPAQPSETKAAPKLPGLITWIRIVMWLAALALIGVVSIPAIRSISKKASKIASMGSRETTPVADTSNAVDINYQDHSSLSPGTICKISNYRVLTTMSDGVIAMFDHAQDYKAKTAARAFVGDGLVTLAEMGENSSKPNIAIITNRNLCDDDAIPTIYARYEGVVDIALGRLRCFREVNPKR